jgi:hypothetical protein
MENFLPPQLKTNDSAGFRSLCRELSFFQVFLASSLIGLICCAAVAVLTGGMPWESSLRAFGNETSRVRLHDLSFHDRFDDLRSQDLKQSDAEMVLTSWSSGNLSNSFSSLKARSCVAQISSLCHNSGSDKCNWKGAGCGYSNQESWSLTKLFPNQTFVFHGDSTLRETFSVWSYYCCPWAAPVLKADTNMTSRTVISRVHHGANVKSFFRFDYLFDHLLEPLKIVENETVDVVVIGMGMYHAKAITTNEPNATSLLQLQSKIDNVIKVVCDIHRAKVGFYVGGWMECGAMKHHKAKAVRQNYRVCHYSTQTLRAVNKMVHETLQKQLERPDGCYVHYVQPLRCHGQKHFCTGDGVHARSNGNYGNSKFQLVFNAVKTVYQNAPAHLLPQGVFHGETKEFAATPSEASP